MEVVAFPTSGPAPAVADPLKGAQAVFLVVALTLAALSYQLSATMISPGHV